MDFKHTSIWKAAFEIPRSDASPDEQRRLSACYEAMRHRASALVSRIKTDLPHMTIHDVTHLDALWSMASIACGSQVNLNPAEAFVFGGAVLLHDAAMTIAAFPGGLDELKQTTEWQDLHARHIATLQEQGATPTVDIEYRATEDALRLLHAKKAEGLPKASWLGPDGQPMFIIEDQQIRNFYGPKIGKISHSHWWPIQTVEEVLHGELGALPGVTECTVDLLKIASLLRVADAMHLDQARAPAFEFALAQPTGVSANHWKFQHHMAIPFVRGDALVYTAQPPFEADEAEAWWTAFDALQVVDRELRNVDRLLRDYKRATFVVRRVDGAQSPSDLARTVEANGWTPVDSTIRVSDVPKIVATLGGSKLYGANLQSPIRELIQNGSDAIIARRRLQSRSEKWGELKVILDTRTDGHWLCIEDNGVGMSTSVLTGPLIDFGNSFWRSSLAIQEFPGLAAAGMKPKGKYGIGFFSVFMLGDHVRVISRRYDRNVESAQILEFRNGLASRPNLKQAAPNEAPVDGGTRVEVKLRLAPDNEGGILKVPSYFKEKIISLGQVIDTIAPASDVDINSIHNGKLVGTIRASDWLDIDSATLLNRIWYYDGLTTAKSPHTELADLKGDDGRIYGRASISTTNKAWSPMGVITVDGLKATHIGPISGLLVGIETTADRNSAQPIVPPEVLATWASKQAVAIANGGLTYTQKAIAAEIILACGGDIGDLPIVVWQNKWMSASQFKKEVRNHDVFFFHEEFISHESDDDVSKSHFEVNFTKDSLVVEGLFFEGSQTGWISTIARDNGKSISKLIEDILTECWGSFEGEDGTLVVGNVDGIEIHRVVYIYRRSPIDP